MEENGGRQIKIKGRVEKLLYKSDWNSIEQSNRRKIGFKLIEIGRISQIVALTKCKIEDWDK